MRVCPNCKESLSEDHFYKGNGRCKVCKKAYDKEYRKKNRVKQAQSQKDRRASADGYVDRFIERSRIRTPDTDLTRDFFTDKMDVCAFTGVAFTYVNEYNCYHNPIAPSIDRIDSKEGYYSWNTQVILSCLNRMKNDMPQEDFNNLWAALMEGEKQ